jgi:hypothetical protein
MTADTAFVAGPAALLRVAALPVPTWLAGGSTALFERLRGLDERTAAQRARASAVAGQVGVRLVPHPAVDAHDRARALAVRRWLHNGAATPCADAAAVADLAELALPGERLAVSLRVVIAVAASLHALRRDLEAAAAAEEERLLAVPWQLLHESPAARRAAVAGDLALYDDIARRVAAGEPWTTKRMRQRSDYLWRMITRGAARATPRGWLGHVALLGVASRGGWSGTGLLTIRDGVATDMAENIDRRRAAGGTAGALESGSSAEIALAPLVRLDPAQLIVWTIDGDTTRRLGEVRLRRSPALDAVIAALDGQARPVDQVLDALAGPDPARRQALTGLLAHLVHRGALQVTVPIRRSLTGWRPLRDRAAAHGQVTSQVTGHLAGQAGHRVVEASGRANNGANGRANDVAAGHAGEDGFPGGYVDVYRRAATGLSRSYAERLGNLAALALRVVALTDEDGPAAAGPPSMAVLGPQPRPLLEVAADCVRAEIEIKRGRPHYHEWPPVRQPTSRYAGLIHAMTERMAGADKVDLDEQTLDAFGAPRVAIDWPIDCLLRPLSGGTGELAVFDQFIPAGLYDARFAPALTDLHGEPPQVGAYREFLTRLGAAAGRQFVEILLPPMSQVAANAVRRPQYTRLWTGDPDRSGHLQAGQSRYLPLSRITLRTRAGQVVAEADGEPIWPIMHTARTAIAPWQMIADLLLLASPQPSRIRWRALSYSLAAWPERDYVPRITIGGRLILTPAQWRIDRSELWHRGDQLTGKVTALASLRHRRRLPRLVSVAVHVHGEPLAVDLCSLHGLRALERLVERGAPALLVRELLAEPDRLPVQDEAAAAGQPSVAELLLRLPAGTPAAPVTAAGGHARTDASTPAGILPGRPARQAPRPRGPVAVSTADR